MIDQSQKSVPRSSILSVPVSVLLVSNSGGARRLLSETKVVLCLAALSLGTLAIAAGRSWLGITMSLHGQSDGTRKSCDRSRSI